MLHATFKNEAIPSVVSWEISKACDHYEQFRLNAYIWVHGYNAVVQVCRVSEWEMHGIEIVIIDRLLFTIFRHYHVGSVRGSNFVWLVHLFFPVEMWGRIGLLFHISIEAMLLFAIATDAVAAIVVIARVHTYFRMTLE